MNATAHLHVAVPAEDYQRGLISCQAACPVHTDARGYVRAIAEGRFRDAYLIARGPNPFASICGRICGAPCEAACRRGKVPRVDADGRFVANDRPIAIRALKRFACEQSGPETRPCDEVITDLRSYQSQVSADVEEMAALVRAGVSGAFEAANGEKVAIIGAGPAGLAAAHDLALMGFRPIVYEAERTPAGMLAFGVPEYRLPREVITREVAVIEKLGVEIRCGVAVGTDVTLADLRRVHAAVIIAVGAKSSRGLGLEGEQGPGVLGGVDLLRAVALGEEINVGRRIVVVGGGNVAYDVARTVLRQIAYDAARTAIRLSGTGSVTLASLETLEEMPADTLEILEGDEEGVTRLNGWGPTAIHRDSNGSVTGIEFRRCLRVYDESRRFSPVFDENDRRLVPCDTVVLAVGQAPQLSFLGDGGEDVEFLRPGWPKVDPATLASTAQGVFVAGDLAHGTPLLIDAVASGKKAARSVYQFITGRHIEPAAVVSHIRLDRYHREAGYEAIRRVPVPVDEPTQRIHELGREVELGYDVASAVREASRCLDCGVTPIFDGSRCVLCGGCADVCPTECLKLVPLSEILSSDELDTLINSEFGDEADLYQNSAILKDEDRCIRCALCVERCPVDAIAMERVAVCTSWKSL